MDIGSLSTINNTIHLSNLIRAQYSPGRIALPTSGAMYTRLKHVQGVPTHTPDGGYSVSKLRMIDTLVDRLIQLKGQSMESPSPQSDAEAEAMLSRYAQELSTTLNNATPLSQSFRVGLVQPGMLLDLVA